MNTRYDDAEEVFLRASAVTISDEELEQIVDHGMHADAIRTMLYMHDIEFHTACYVRDLLVTRAHADPVTTAFMMRWGFEETHHGCVIARILEAFGEQVGAQRIQKTRKDAGIRSRLRPGGYFFLDLVLPFSALHMVEGAVNEWTAQAAYRMLARRVDNPTFTAVMGRIIRQEGDHAAFYSHHAKRLLSESRRARSCSRLLFGSKWAPVGAGVVKDTEIDFVARYLFGPDDGHTEITNVDRKLQGLPGMDGLQPLEKALTQSVPSSLRQA